MALSKTNISTSLVASELGAATHDVGALCTHPSINPWAKCKPVNLKEPFPDRTTQWWKGDNGRCGFNIGIKDEYGNIHKLTRLDDVPNADWYYDFVTASNPKRLADFGGYDASALPVIASRIDKDNITINKSKGSTHTFYFDVTYQGDEYSFGTEDFDSFANYFYAAAIKGADTHGSWREFRGTSLRDSNGSVSIEIGNLADGTYDCVLFASTSINPKIDGDMMPLPSNIQNKTKFTITIQNIFSFDIVLDYVSRNFPTNYWTYAPDIEDYDPETGKGGYKCPKSGTLFYKGRVIRTHEETDDTVNTVDFKGESDNFIYGTWKKGMNHCFFDINGKELYQISTPGVKNGDYQEIIVKWDGYTGDTDWDDTSPIKIDGGLDILNGTAYIGGCPPFDLVR